MLLHFLCSFCNFVSAGFWLLGVTQCFKMVQTGHENKGDRMIRERAEVHQNKMFVEILIGRFLLELDVEGGHVDIQNVFHFPLDFQSNAVRCHGGQAAFYRQG